MNYLNMALQNMKRHIFTYILVLIELAVLFLTVNYAVSIIADRLMLIRPFSGVIGKDSTYVYDYEAILTHNITKALESRQKLLDNLSCEYDVYDVMVYYGDGVEVISVNDEIFSRLRLPLSVGNRRGALGGKVLPGKRTVYFGETPVEFNITGTLTDPSYIPMMSSFQSADMTTKDFFISSSENENSFIITDRSSIEDVKDRFVTNLGFIIKFHKNAEENIKLLSTLTSTVSGDRIEKNNAAAIQNDLSDFFPIFGCVFLITMIGVVSISVIMYLHNERQNGILWICGYSRRQMISVQIVNTILMLAMSFAISAAAFFIMRALEIEIVKNMILTGWNALASAAMFVFFGTLALTIPAVKSAKTSPVEYLRRTL